jgi:hypothetical protein
MEEDGLDQHARRISQLRVLNAWELVVARPPIRASTRNLLNPFFVADLSIPLKAISDGDYDSECSDADRGSIPEEAVDDAVDDCGSERVTSSELDAAATGAAQATRGISGQEEGPTSPAGQKGYATAIGQLARTSSAQGASLLLHNTRRCLLGQDEPDAPPAEAASTLLIPQTSTSSPEAKRVGVSNEMTAAALAKLPYLQSKGAEMFKSCVSAHLACSDLESTCHNCPACSPCDHIWYKI